MTSSDDKLRLMEEEMSRFEAEIAGQTPSSHVPVVSASSINTTLLYPPTNLFIPHQLQNPQVPGVTPPMPPGVSLFSPFVQSAAATYPVQTTIVSASATYPVQINSGTTPLTIINASSDVASKVITAPPQMAGPTELAARAKETSKLKPTSPLRADDDDVTRALLTAAAGVTYKCLPESDATKKPATTLAKPTYTPVVPLTGSGLTNATTGVVRSVIPTVPEKTHPIPNPLPPLSLPPPPYRAGPITSANTSQLAKKKKYIRVAAGVTWVDPTLSEWDPNDFRMFCGDLGNDVSDDTLTRAFNRYPSFQKARVVRDKRTGKSRGYGFVSFSDPADFTLAMREMNGKYVGNRPIKLKRSDWRSRQLETHRKKDKERRKLGLKN